MKIEIKKVIWPSIISSCILFLFGLLLIFYSSETLLMVSYTIGGILIALGILALIRFFRGEHTDIFNQLNIVYGIVCILAGAFFIKEPKLIGSIIPVVLGISIIISSSLKIQQSFFLKKMGSSYFVGSLVTALLSLLCGVVLVFNPFKSASLIMQIIGIFLVFYAILDIVNTILLKQSGKIDISLSTEVEEEKPKKKKKKVKDAKIVKEESDDA